jgi:hypothetical protein
MEVAYIDIEHFLDAGSFAGRTASNANPKKALWIQGLTADQRNDLQTYWRSEVHGSAEMPIIGGDKAESIELGLVSDQALFLGWQTFKINVIAAAFGLVSMKANIIAGVSRSTGDNMSESSDEGAIKPMADSIAGYINQYVLPLYGLGDVAEFRFVYTALSDRKALAVVHQVLLQADVIKINESRAEMGLPPLVHPKTGENIGDYTLTAYRAMFKSPAASVDGPEAALEEQRQQLADQAKQNDQATGGDFGENSNNTNPDKSQRGGNGVASASKPKEKAYNQRSDSSTEMT